MAFFTLKDSPYVLNTDLIKLIMDKGDVRAILYSMNETANQVIETPMSVEELINGINAANQAYIGNIVPVSESEKYYEHLNKMNEFQKVTQKRLNQLEHAFAEDNKLYDFTSTHHKKKEQELSK